MGMLERSFNESIAGMTKLQLHKCVRRENIIVMPATCRWYENHFEKMEPVQYLQRIRLLHAITILS